MSIEYKKFKDLSTEDRLKIATQHKYFTKNEYSEIYIPYDDINPAELNLTVDNVESLKQNAISLPNNSIDTLPELASNNIALLRFNPETKKIQYLHNTTFKSKNNHNFGLSCSISGNWIVVGAPYEDTKGSGAGAAYVFYNSGGTWVETQILYASDGQANDFFGASCSISGDWMIVGADREDTKAGDAGAVYVFYNSGGTWVETQILYASDAQASDFFGASCSISGDWMIVGAYWEDTKGSDAGAAYVFYNSGGTWVETQILYASDAQAIDYFGWSCSISGNWMVIGAPYEDTKGTNAGVAYMFYNNNGIWLQTQILYASDAQANDNFGYSCSISGNWAIVGAYYEDTKGSDAGAAYVFYNNGGTWVQTNKLVASDGEANHNFGLSCSISGNWIVVGAPYEDTKGSGAGAAYVFYNSGGTWVETQILYASDGEGFDYFGYSCSVSGNWMVVGAYQEDTKESNAGAAYVFYNSGGTWVETQILYASDGEEFDYFGISCSIDKDWMVVGASNKDTINTDNGVAYIFYNSGGTWVETNKLKILDSDSEIYDYFGWSCGISGNWIVVGAPYKDILESDEGVAYMFYNNGSTWGETNKLMASDEVEWKTLI